MATLVKRVEKDFFLKVLYDDQLPIVFLYNHTEYVLRVERPAKKEILLQADRRIPGLKPRKKMNLMFQYHSKVITFTVEVGTIQDTHITATAPDFLYKNLNRANSRVATPPNLEVEFAFRGERYSLPFPKIKDLESGETTQFMKEMNSPDRNGLLGQMEVWIKDFASGYKMGLFKESPPATLEEKLLAETGKAIFLPITRAAIGSPGSLPYTDPGSKKKLVTADMLRRYLETTGVGKKDLDKAVARFCSSKFNGGIFSDAWVPIIFQDYVIGYIHIWIDQEGVPPLSNENLETIYQFTRVLAFSLKTNGYFDAGMVKNEPFKGNVIDISVSGLLFACPDSELSSSLLPDTMISVVLNVLPMGQPYGAVRSGAGPTRTINTTAQIVRRYTDKTTNYFGCPFTDMAPDDTRFLFEFIYGRPFTDRESSFLSGCV
jgi:hypothetical protein